MKKILALILALLMVFSMLAACGANNEVAKEDPKNETESNEGKRTMITVGIESNVATLTPILKISGHTASVTGMVFENLGQFVGTEFTGVLMESWEKVDDVTYKVKLYDYIYDAAGNHFTSSDVAYCVQRASEGGISYAKYAKEIEIIDDANFVLHLAAADVGYFEDFCQSIWMYTQKAMEASSDDMATDPVGTGPYVCTLYESSSEYRFEARDNYWQKPELTPACSKANVDVVRYLVIKEAAQMAVALQNDTVQLAYWVPSSVVKDVQKIDGLNVEQLAITQMRNMVFNCSENSIFGGENGKLLRQAVAYACNSQAMVDAGLGGLGQPTYGWGKRGTIGYNEAWEDQGYYSYNPEKAKELLVEAGYPDGFECTFYGVDNNWSRQFMQVVQANCAAVGITMHIDWMTDNVNASMQRNLSGPANGAWDIYQISTSHPAGYQQGYFNYLCDVRTSNNGYNYFGLNDPELQALVEAAGSLDWTQEDVDALHDTVVENCYVYTPFDSSQMIAYSEDIEEVYYRNFRKDPLIHCATFAEDWSYFYEE